MAITEKFEIKATNERSAFDKRLARVGGRLSIERAKLADRRDTVLAKMWNKVDALDMSEQGSGLKRLNSLLLANAETGKPPMIFTKPSEEARDPLDVAFGDKNFSGKDILAVADGAALGQGEIETLQKVFPDGVTIVGQNSNIGVNYADYEHFLRPNDAVVVLHEAEPQEFHAEHQHTADV